MFKEGFPSLQINRLIVLIDTTCVQVNSASLQKGEEKIREKSLQMTEEVRRRETALLTELRRVSGERQSTIDAELDRIRYNITRFDNNPFPAPP